MATRLATVGVAGLLAAACGDPAVFGDYEGEALFEVDGLVCAVGAIEVPTTAVGIVWKRFGPDAALAPGEAGPVDTARLPAPFELDVYDVPPAATASLLAGPDAPVAAAIGVPVLFDDVDRDGVLAVDGEGGDRLLGLARGQVVLHIAEGAGGPGGAPELTLGGPEVAPGYHLAEAVCDGERLAGFEIAPRDTRVDVWLVETAIEGLEPTEMLAPETCLTLF